MFLQGWVNGILINESSVYGTLCIVLLKILNMGLYFSEIDTRGWPYRRQDLLLLFNHSFAKKKTKKKQEFCEGLYKKPYRSLTKSMPMANIHSVIQCLQLIISVFQRSVCSSNSINQILATA